jgi:hypothetical protein
MQSGLIAIDEELWRENTRESSATSGSRASDCWREATARCPRDALAPPFRAMLRRLLENGSWMRGQKGGPPSALPVFYLCGKAARWRWPEWCLWRLILRVFGKRLNFYVLCVKIIVSSKRIKRSHTLIYWMNQLFAWEHMLGFKTCKSHTKDQKVVVSTWYQHEVSCAVNEYAL